MDSPLQIFRELLPFGQNSAEQKSAAAVRGLLDTLGLGALVAVEQNRDVVPRSEHTTRRVAEGDTFEIVHFVGRG